jgi:hypothetical protein
VHLLETILCQFYNNFCYNCRQICIIGKLNQNYKGLTMSIFVKSGGSLFSFKTLSLSLLFSLFLIGCGGGGGGGSSPTTHTIEHTISFLDGNFAVINSTSKSGGNVNISAIADEAGVTGAIYAVDDVVVRGNPDYEVYNLVRDVNFYTVTGVKSVSDQAGLDAIRTALGGKYVLTADIDLDPAGAGFTTTGWTKIGAGTSAATRFSGILDGNGYTISGLWTNLSSGGDDYIGLFSYISNARIKNLNIEIADGKEIKGNDNHVGALAGYATGSTITNVRVTGNVTAADNYVGGIIGQIVGASTIANSCFEGTVNGDQYVGGIVGRAEGASVIKNSCFIGTVASLETGDGDVGGIVGYITGAGSSVKNSYSSGIVGAYGGYVGGIAGEVYTGSSVLNSYSDANVISGGVNAGGIAGYVYSSSASVKNSYSLGAVNGTTYVGGIAGRVYYGDPVIQNNVAINPSVTGSGTTYKNRVATAYANGGYLDATSNNFAFDGIVGTFTQSTNVKNHGISKTAAELATNTTYMTDLGWNFGNDDDNPWVWGAFATPYPTLYWE